MTLKASLPMYDWLEIRPSTDAFWHGLARYVGLKGELSRPAAHVDLWRDPAMLFSQTCGYPFTHEFKGQLKYIATPHYACEGCEGPNYSSYIFARKSLPQNPVPAVNSLDSMSGYLALKLVRPNLARPLLTGSHVASLIAVQSGKADICAIDAVVVALARRHRPELLQGLVQVAQSPMVPGLPFVTRAGDVGNLQKALHKIFTDGALNPALAAMLLQGFSILPAHAYDVILKLEADL